MDDTWVLERLVFGMRHKRTFQVTDKLGEFVDTIIPLQGHYPFPEKSFTKVGRPNHLSVEVTDTEKTLSVTYNTDGLILNCDMLAEPPLEKNTVLQMFNNLANVAIPLTDGKSKIDRLGVVLQYTISPYKNAAKEIYSKILNTELKGTPDNMNIRFALKYPVSESVYNPDKKTDYKNVLIEILSDRDKEVEDEMAFPTAIRLSVDYQLYYEPARSFKAVNMETHFSDALSYITNSIMKSNINFEPEKAIYG